MAITFQCTCGQTLEVDDKHAGKKAKCPRCGNSITIPSTASEESLCPNCGKPMEDNAVICMECGFNRKTGGRIATDEDLPGLL